MKSMIIELAALGADAVMILFEIHNEMDGKENWLSDKKEKDRLSSELKIARSSIDRHLTLLKVGGFIHKEERGIYIMKRSLFNAITKLKEIDSSLAE